MNEMSDMSDEFKFVESFDVDNGELDDLPRELCFVLGVEWEMIRQKVELRQPFEQPIHSENVKRIEKLCNLREVSYRIIPHDDWLTLII